MEEQHRAGLEYLQTVTTLMQRVRLADPSMGVFEAADFQWWWRVPRPTDEVPQLFWFDDSGQPAAAVIATDWGGPVALDPIVLPESSPEWTSRVVARGIAHADDLKLGEVDFAIDLGDEVMAAALAQQGFTNLQDELVDSWISEARRPPISALHDGYRLQTRRDTRSVPHHMTARSGPGVEERMLQTSLYRPDLDLVVLDGDEEPAAYALFWYDPVTETGLVEPMRTEDGHQRRGLARHLLTAGLNRLFDAGAHRVKIAWSPSNEAAHRLYTSVGFDSIRPCALASRPNSDNRRY